MPFRKSGPEIAGFVQFPALDGLRLLASLNIVLFHLVASGALVTLVSAGWAYPFQKAPLLNTSIFFLLSGFLFQIRTAVRSEIPSASKFLKSRFQRLYGLHVITVLAMAVFGWIRFVDQRSWEWMLQSVFMHISLAWAWWPFGTLGLNQPSWAVGAFLFCYLLFIPVFRVVQRENSRWKLGLALLSCLLFLVLWWGSYLRTALVALGNDNFNFHHMFPPARFVEFLAGMLLGRLRTVVGLSVGKSSSAESWMPSWQDGVLVVVVALLWQGQHLLWSTAPAWPWLQYHVLSPVGAAALVWLLSSGRGVIVAFLSLHWLRILGQAGFYPYLLHIPLLALCGIVIEDAMGRSGWLNEPTVVGGFLVLLYGGSVWFDQSFGKAKLRKFYFSSHARTKP